MDKLDEHERAMTDEKPLERKDGFFITVTICSWLIVWWLFFKWWLS
jgi:hypothetical protein